MHVLTDLILFIISFPLWEESTKLEGSLIGIQHKLETWVMSTNT